MSSLVGAKHYGRALRRRGGPSRPWEQNRVGVYRNESPHAARHTVTGMGDRVALIITIGNDIERRETGVYVEWRTRLTGGMHRLTAARRPTERALVEVSFKLVSLGYKLTSGGFSPHIAYEGRIIAAREGAWAEDEMRMMETDKRNVRPWAAPGLASRMERSLARGVAIGERERGEARAREERILEERQRLMDAGEDPERAGRVSGRFHRESSTRVELSSSEEENNE